MCQCVNLAWNRRCNLKFLICSLMPAEQNSVWSGQFLCDYEIAVTLSKFIDKYLWDTACFEREIILLSFFCGKGMYAGKMPATMSILAWHTLLGGWGVGVGGTLFQQDVVCMVRTCTEYWFVWALTTMTQGHVTDQRWKGKLSFSALYSSQLSICCSWFEFLSWILVDLLLGVLNLMPELLMDLIQCQPFSFWYLFMHHTPAFHSFGNMFGNYFQMALVLISTKHFDISVKGALSTL